MPTMPTNRPRAARDETIVWAWHRAQAIAADIHRPLGQRARAAALRDRLRRELAPSRPAATVVTPTGYHVRREHMTRFYRVERPDGTLAAGTVDCFGQIQIVG